MRIVLLGAPGSGKGTQAQKLQAKYNVPQISSGDLLRDAVARGTDLGLKAKAIMDAGQLVSDEIVLGLIRDRLGRADASNGFVLDGYPRNIDQAAALAQLLDSLGRPLNAVLLLDVRRETLMTRLAGRRALQQRPDDSEEVIAKRLEVYEEQTKPLIEHYSNLGLLRVVAGEGELAEVFERMEAAALAKPVPAGRVSVTRAAVAGVRKRTAKAKRVPRNPGRRRTAAKKSTRKAVKKSATAVARKPVKKASRKAPSRKAVRAKAVRPKLKRAKPKKKAAARNTRISSRSSSRAPRRAVKSKRVARARAKK